MPARPAKPPSETPADPLIDAPAYSFIDRFWGKLLMALLATVMLSLAFAPFEQFYLAYIGIVPWLLILRHSRSWLRAFCWAFLGGMFFFAANVWWLLPITGPGVAALVPVLALYWAAASLVIYPVVRRLHVPVIGRFAWLRSPRTAVLVVFPFAWVAQEWLRATWPWGAFPWHFVGHTQTPVLMMCQIADIFGEFGVSFWVAMLNAVVLLFVVDGWRVRRLAWPAGVVALLTILIGVYGWWRFSQYDESTTPGPAVLVVQPNFPQSNTGQKGASYDEILAFHGPATLEGLASAAQAEPPTPVDLVVWSETMMPPLNNQALFWAQQEIEYADGPAGQRASLAIDELTTRPALPKPTQSDREAALRQAFALDIIRSHNFLADTARRRGVGMLVGGSFLQPRQSKDDSTTGRANAAYFYLRGDGHQSREPYRKIHLVPFGEFVPFRESFPWLHQKLLAFGPGDMAEYQLDRGDKAVVFELSRNRQGLTADRLNAGNAPKPWRFVTPICFEDVDGDLCAWLFRGGAARGEVAEKQADLIVNITNDGWFRGTQMPQHFQIARFRSIENRVPTARAVNTGISGFIDSMGRSSRELQLPAGTPRPLSKDPTSLSHTVRLDSRTTFFTRYGNWFGPLCGILAGWTILFRIGRRVFVEK
jgi:apolipoprotein N-acyltransferase